MVIHIFTSEEAETQSDPVCPRKFSEEIGRWSRHTLGPASFVIHDAIVAS